MGKKTSTHKKGYVTHKVGSILEIPVFGIPFKVQFVEEVDKDNSYGETEGPERTIKIRQSLPPELLEATILHEICHAVLYTAGVSELLDENLEEAIVVAMENGLSQLYQRKSLSESE